MGHSHFLSVTHEQKRTHESRFSVDLLHDIHRLTLRSRMRHMSSMLLVVPTWRRARMRPGPRLMRRRRRRHDT